MLFNTPANTPANAPANAPVVDFLCCVRVCGDGDGGGAPATIHGHPHVKYVRAITVNGCCFSKTRCFTSLNRTYVVGPDNLDSIIKKVLDASGTINFN